MTAPTEAEARKQFEAMNHNELVAQENAKTQEDIVPNNLSLRVKWIQEVDHAQT